MLNRKYRKVSIVNHKGGVGKTTLTYNLAAMLTALDKTVLLVDADPQCNLSTYVIDPTYFDRMLDESEGPKGSTIWSALKPVSEGTGPFRQVSPIESPTVGYLLPGDISLSLFEADLYTFWAECFQRKIRGFNGITALSQLVDAVATEFGADFVFFDTGPNIGALNRAVILDADYFIVAAACDLFSQRAVVTLGATIADWIVNWRVIAELAPDDAPLLAAHPTFIGYIPQGFKVYGGMVSSQAQMLPGLEVAIQRHVVERLNKIDPNLVNYGDRLTLPMIQYFSSLAAVSQATGDPMYQAKGASTSLETKAFNAFKALAVEVLRRTGGE